MLLLQDCMPKPRCHVENVTRDLACGDIAVEWVSSAVG